MSVYRPAFWFLFFLLTLLVSGAAAQTVVLQADFDADTPGELPSTDLPGDPAGDYLDYDSRGGMIEVRAEAGAMTQQPVVVIRDNVTYPIYVRFWIDPEYRDCSVYLVRWKSMVSRMVQYFYVMFSAPNTQVIGSLEYRGGGVLTANRPTNVLDATYSPNVPREFEVRLDIENDTVDVSVDGVPDPSGQGLLPYQVSGDGLRFVALNFGMSDFYQVTFDDLHVEATGCPGVPGDTMSWGALKAIYD